MFTIVIMAALCLNDSQLCSNFILDHPIVFDENNITDFLLLFYFSTDTIIIVHIIGNFYLTHSNDK